MQEEMASTKSRHMGIVKATVLIQNNKTMSYLGSYKIQNYNPQ